MIPPTPIAAVPSTSPSNSTDHSSLPSGAFNRHLVARNSYVTSTAVYAGRETLSGGYLRHAGDSFNLYQYNVGNAALNAFRLAPRLASSIAFPSQKAYQFERYDWSSRSQPLYFAIGNARCAVLTFDGAASARQLEEANAGAYTTFYNTFTHLPAPILYDPFEPNSLYTPGGPVGAPTQGTARLEFTYRQQLGRDFGPQVP